METSRGTIREMILGRAELATVGHQYILEGFEDFARRGRLWCGRKRDRFLFRLPWL